MKIDFVASERQYVDHLLPVWWMLHKEERGQFHVQPDLHAYLHYHGVMNEDIGPRKPHEYVGEGQGPVLAASFQDARTANTRVVALLEHGAGQAYGDAHPSNAGGDRRDFISAFLCPNETVGLRNRVRYPEARVDVVGCPKLDVLSGWAHSSERELWKEQHGPTVAISFHWNNPQCQESHWAWPEFGEAALALARGGEYKVIGHAHPRIRRLLDAWWTNNGVEFVEDFRDVVARADVYVCDNSSTMYEFAALGRPVVAMNARMYRKDVHHGLRFWDYVPGVQIDKPTTLSFAIRNSLEDEDGMVKHLRDKAVAFAYGDDPFGASIRAANALRELAETPDVHRRALTPSSDPYRPRAKAR